MTITRFDKPTLRNLRVELEAVLNKYSKESANGVVFTVGNMKFSENEVAIKVDAKIDGKPTRDQGTLAMMAKFHNLTLEPRAGKQLIRYNTKGQKYPWIYSHMGKNYKCDDRTAKLYFGNEE